MAIMVISLIAIAMGFVAIGCLAMGMLTVAAILSEAAAHKIKIKNKIIDVKRV